MSTDSHNKLSNKEERLSIGKDKKVVYLQMPSKKPMVDELFGATISLKDVTDTNDSQISLVSDHMEQDWNSNFLQVTDVTAINNSTSPAINVVPTQISPSIGFKTLQMKSSTPTNIRIVRNTSNTHRFEHEKNPSKEVQVDAKVQKVDLLCSRAVKRFHVDKKAISATVPNPMKSISPIIPYPLKTVAKCEIMKLENMQTSLCNNTLNNAISHGTIQSNGEMDYMLNKVDQHEIIGGTDICTEESQFSVDEKMSTSSEEICLEVDSSDTYSYSDEIYSSQTSPVSSVSPITDKNITSLIKPNGNMNRAKSSSPKNEQATNNGETKLFIRTDSVTVRRRVTKDKNMPIDKGATKTFINSVNDIVNSIHRNNSPDVNSAKFVITCDSLSHVNVASKSSSLRKSKPESCTEFSQNLDVKLVQKSVKRQRCAKEPILSTSKKKKTDGDIVCCAYCGNYGILLESLTDNDNYFCSEECLKEYREEKGPKKDEEVVEQGENVGKLPKERVPAVPFPWGDEITSFKWELYLNHVYKVSPEMIAAPSNLWKTPYPSKLNSFKIGMKLEAIDPFHQSLFCVATVQNINGYMVRIHFDGYPSVYDFWCNANSPFIFPMDWCKENARTLRCPPGILNFTWEAYLDHCKQKRSAMASNFGPIVTNNVYGFEIGMKLEAEDRKNCLICVATVMDVIGCKILVTFDGWESIYDAWFDISSPFIHPIGWAQNNDMDLCAPKDYKDPECFHWMEYLVRTSSRAVSTTAFIPRQPMSFKTGMKIEAVDKRNPILLRVATIVDINGYKVKIHFDGWDDIYDYWIDDDSPDIHPPLWSERTGHPLQPPLTQEQCALDVDSGLGCGTPGCKGIGHTKGLIYDNHHTIHGCPYSLQNINIDLESYSIDRLNSVPVKKGGLKNAINLERNVSPSVEEDTQGKRVRKRRRFFDEISDAQESKNVKVEETSRKSPVSQPKPVNKTPPPQNKVNDTSKSENMSSCSHESVFSPTCKEKPPQKGAIPDLGIGRLNYKNISKLMPSDIKSLVQKVERCDLWGNKFIEQDIDGTAFIMLKQSDLTNVMKITLGPSKKIMQCVKHLRLACNA